MPVSVVDEKEQGGFGVRVVVRMRRVAVGKTAGSYQQAIGIRGRAEWCRHTMGRRQLVQITGGLADADGQEEVLVVGQEVWDEWTGQPVARQCPSGGYI